MDCENRGEALVIDAQGKVATFLVGFSENAIGMTTAVINPGDRCL